VAIGRVVGPQTDQELLDAVEDLTGYHIPRVAVCVEHGHKAPAQTFCDLYFGRALNVLWIGNRGGGKTTNSGFLHGAKGRWNPGYQSAIAGAVQRQGYRAYAEFQRFIRTVSGEILDTIQSRTRWLNGALTEVLGGTIAQLNGPHPHLAQFDELELIVAAAVFQEFLNMAQGDSHYPGQQLLTSTRKRAAGIVQQIVKETEEAVRWGDEAPWRVDIFCVFETMQRVPNCRSVPENQGRPEEELCQCHKKRKGTWDDGTPRTFEQVCGGKAFRSDGFVGLVDVHKRFTQLSRFVWESQQECLKPDIEGLVHKWLKERHRLPAWFPFPMFGPVFRGWDFGGQNPHAIVWCQYLTNAVGLWKEVYVDEALGPMERWMPVLDDKHEAEIVLPAGSIVQFDEIYGNSEMLGEFSDLGVRAVIRHQVWRSYGFDFPITIDGCDPAGFVAKREIKKAIRKLIERIEDDNLDADDLAVMEQYDVDVEWIKENHNIQVPSFSSIPLRVADSVRKHIEYGEDDRLYLVEHLCPATSDEYDAYRWPDDKPDRNKSEEPVKEDDHAMDAKRYGIFNFERWLDRGAGSHETPGSAGRPEPATASEPPSKYERPRTLPSESPVGSRAGGRATTPWGDQSMRGRDLPSVRSGR
jgi:hypothetical protein